MYICSKKFLNIIKRASKEEVHRYIQPSSKDHIRVLQLSDIHIYKDRSSTESSSEIIDGIRHDVASLRELWGQTRETSPESPSDFDGLIVSGDFIDAPKIGRAARKANSGSYREIQSSNHVLVRSVVTDLLRDLLKNPNALPENSCCMVVPGNHDLAREGEHEDGENNKIEARVGSYFDNIHKPFCKEAAGVDDFMGSPSISMIGDPNNGVLILIGLDSNQNAYMYDDLWPYGLVHAQQMTLLGDFLQILTDKLPNVPLYPIAILHHHLLPVERFEKNRTISVESAMSSVVLDSRNVIEELSHSRVSLVTHGHMHESVIQRVGYWNFSTKKGRRKGLAPPPLHIVGCPSFYYPEGDNHQSLGGGLVLDVNLNRGTIRVDVLDAGNDGQRATSVVFPLVSASRTSPSEMRVYRRLCEWSEGLPPSDGFPFSSPSDPRKAILFNRIRDRIWEEHGYALLCSIPPSTETSVKLSNSMGFAFNKGISLPVEKDDRNIAEKKYRLLIVLMYDSRNEPYILLNNQIPVRETSYGGWDSLLLPAFNDIDSLLMNLRNDLNRIHDNLMVQEISETSDDYVRLDGVKKVLSSLPNLQDKGLQNELIDLGSREFYKFSPMDGQPQLYNMTLSVFPRFSLPPEDPKSLAPAISSLKKITHKHTFRWEPGKDDNQSEDGYVWFPIRRWRESPAIVTRNADVMDWVEREVMKREPKALAPWLICGGGEAREHNYGITGVQVMPFEVTDNTPGHVVPANFPTSLCEGLENVRYNTNRELSSQSPYRGIAAVRAILRRTTDELGGTRDRISVLSVDSAGQETLRGYLRPVQRYVLHSGLERSRRLDQICQDLAKTSITRLATAGIGFLILNRSVGDNIALLPPIIELLAVNDKENPSSALSEFIVCDGNHRVVQLCWNERRDLHCVMLDGELEHPYYAHPYSSLDWNITAANVLHSAPDLYGKYTPRKPVECDSKEEVKKWGEFWFRRFYRDLETGFSHLGQQGGNV